MLTRNLIRICVFSIIGISLFSCKTDEVIPGAISGYVTEYIFIDSPLKEVSMKIIPSNDKTITDSNGEFKFKNLIPGDYEIEASKIPYVKATKRATVTSGEITPLHIILHKVPFPSISKKYLDFGFDSTTLYFSISKLNEGKLYYVITTSQEWITVFPATGEITNEADIIKATINRTGLSSDNTTKEFIRIISTIGNDSSDITIDVYLNRVRDIDGNYYKVVKIGSQIWMAENLKTTHYSDGTIIPLLEDSVSWINLDYTSKAYCYYNNRVEYSDIYGALYNWAAAMNGTSSSNLNPSGVQGVCPDGWHLPSDSEWKELEMYLGMSQIEANKSGNRGTVEGGKLKSSGYTYWESPNTGATNSSGFTALPSGTQWQGMPIFGLRHQMVLGMHGTEFCLTVILKFIVLSNI
jgi:uncharacterized protein (TIGR02145 family)